MVNKRGDQKYYIIISLILGLVILTISLYWIFQEFFNEDEIDWEVCRQSIILRAGLPAKDLPGLELDAKDAFPLKCKTEVVTIDDLSSPDKVYEVISKAIAEGWYMFGRGKLDFVHRDATEKVTACMAFARIHFDEKVSREFDDKYLGDWSMFLAGRGYVEPFTQGFQNYYRSEGVENSEGTYDQYLPLYMGGLPSKSGNLVVDWDNVDFNPGQDEDYLLVYVINKRAGLFTGKIFTSEAWEDIKVLAIISVDDLDVLGCDKFLTVPA